MSTGSTYLSLRDAARRLGVHENTVRRYIDRGLIRARRLPSGIRRVDEEDVDAVAAEGQAQAVASEDAYRGIGDLAAQQRVSAVEDVEELAVPGLWRSDEELEEFLATTYAERDRER